MPRTRFTQLCIQYCDLIQRVRGVIETEVLGRAEARSVTRSGAIRRRDNVYNIVFIRILRWLHTFEVLNGDMHIQAVGAGARGIYELYVDLRWFKANPNDETYLDRFREYADVDRYLTAKKVVDRKNNVAPKRSISLLTDDDIRPMLATMKSLDAKAARRGLVSMHDLVSKFWGVNDKLEPKWPKHWSGVNTLDARTDAIGAECADEHSQIYPMLCALVHPGPTPEVGRELSDPEWRETLVAFSFGQAYQLARRSTDLFIDLANIRPQLDGYDAACHQLDMWEQDARREMPT